MGTFSKTFGACLVQQGAGLNIWDLITMNIDGTEYYLSMNIEEQEYYIEMT